MNAVPALLAAALAFAPIAVAAEENAPGATGAPPTVAVVGQATEEVKPDVATVSLSVEAEKPTAAEASNENARRAEAVIAALKAAGVDAKDIATVGLSLYPVWNASQNQPRVVSAYQAANRFAVRVQPIEKVGALIAQAAQSGAEYQGVGFDVSDREARENALRTKAVENAARRAELYARGAAMKLGPSAIDPRRRGAAGVPAAHGIRPRRGRRRADAAADRTRTDHAERNRLGELGAGAAVTLGALQPAARNAA